MQRLLHISCKSIRCISRKPTGNAAGSLATSLNLEKEIYDDPIKGHCNRWYHQKAKLVQHMSSETYLNSERTSVRNDHKKKHRTRSKCRTKPAQNSYWNREIQVCSIAVRILNS